MRKICTITQLGLGAFPKARLEIGIFCSLGGKCKPFVHWGCNFKWHNVKGLYNNTKGNLIMLLIQVNVG